MAGVLAPSTSSKPSADATPTAAPGSVNLSTLQEQCVSFLLHGLATSTYKSYASALRKCYKFCVQAGKLQVHGSPCPADEWTLCLSATFLADSLRAASIKVYLSAVYSLHIEYGFPDPVLNFPHLQRVVRAIKCLQGSASSEQPSITNSIMLVIFNSFDLALPDHCMFWAACTLAYFGFLRASKIMVPSANSFPPSDHLTLHLPQRPCMFRLRLQRLTLSERELLFILALESILCALFAPWCPILLYVGMALAPFSSFSRSASVSSTFLCYS